MLKKILPFTGLIAAVLAIVTMILMMATPVATYTVGNTTTNYDGIMGIFGKTQDAGLLGTINWKPGWAGLLGWILVVVAIVALCAAAILQFVLKKYPQIGGILAIVAGAAVIVAGVFCFIGGAAFKTANNSLPNLVPSDAVIGGGWVVAGIIAIVAGVVALCNCILGIVASLKK